MVFRYFFKQKLHFLAMMCVKVCLHMFLLQINQINKIKHSGSVSWKTKKTRNTICVKFQWKISFSLYPARYYATPRHNPRFDFYKNGLKPSARLEGKKVKKFQREKITTGSDITKNVEGGGQITPPALLGLNPRLIKPFSATRFIKGMVTTLCDWKLTPPDMSYWYHSIIMGLHLPYILK